jgi:hypothetical protein
VFYDRNIKTYSIFEKILIKNNSEITIRIKIFNQEFNNFFKIFYSIYSQVNSWQGIIRKKLKIK